jgi:hypothetical protein
MSDVGSIVITCEWPDIQITQAEGQLPSFAISAPLAPLIEFTSAGIRGENGAPGAPGSGAADPGDLNLYFDMALI